MRKKELKLIVTFHTTADAIAVEKACKEQEIPGRMIPVPRELSAGCGLAWCMAPEGREKMEGSFFPEPGVGGDGGDFILRMKGQMVFTGFPGNGRMPFLFHRKLRPM